MTPSCTSVCTCTSKYACMYTVTLVLQFSIGGGTTCKDYCPFQKAWAWQHIATHSNTILCKRVAKCGRVILFFETDCRRVHRHMGEYTDQKWCTAWPERIYARWAYVRVGLFSGIYSMHIHTCTYTHTHLHILYTHTHLHTYIYTNTQRHRHKYTYKPWHGKTRLPSFAVILIHRQFKIWIRNHLIISFTHGLYPPRATL